MFLLRTIVHVLKQGSFYKVVGTPCSYQIYVASIVLICELLWPIAEFVRVYAKLVATKYESLD